jgi:replicative DNA helicase
MNSENLNKEKMKSNKLHIQNVISDGITETPLLYISTGIETIDELIQGIHEGELITLLGDAVSDRDKILLSIFKNICIDNKIPSVYFSNHRSRINDIQLLLASISDVPLEEWNKATTNKDQKQMVLNSQFILSESPAYYDNTPRKKLSALCDDIRTLVHEEKVKVVFIDNFQGIIDDLSTNFNNYFISYIAYHMKSLAMELGVALIVTSMPNYHFYTREGIDSMKPLLGDLAEVGDLNSFSDIVIGFNRPDAFKIYMDERGNNLRNVIEVDILLNCRGKLNSGRMSTVSNNPLKYQKINIY